MKICFYARSAQTKLYAKLSKKFISDGYEVIFITQNKIESQQVKNIVDNAKIYEIETYLSNNWSNFSKDNLDYFEKKYKIPAIWKIFYADRFLNKFSYDDAIKFIIGHFKFYEEIFTNETINFFINETVATFSSYVEYYVGKYFSVKYLGLCCGRTHTDSKFYFVNEPYQLNYELDNLVKKNVFSKKDLYEAETFLENFKNTKFKPEYMEVQGKLPHFTVKFVFLIIKYLVSKIYFKKYRNKFDYMNYNSNNQIINPVVNYLRLNSSRKFYEMPKYNEEYLLFPLHFQPEASTLVCAENYEKQLYAIDLIAKNIPGRYKLYVKEHYAQLGHREISFYKKLKDYPNIKLINPLVDSHELIKNSKGVIVLTSTVGWEAMLYEKPVYILGNIFYETYKNCYKIENISDLFNCINLNTNNIIEKNDLLKYISAYLMSLKNGSYDLEEYCTSEANLMNLYNSINNEIQIKN